MKRLLPLIGVIVLIAALASLNHGISKNATPDVDDDDAPPPATTSAKAATPAPTAPQTPNGLAGQRSDVLPSEVTVNDPGKAKYRVTIGWSYDAANQSDSTSVTNVIRQATAMAQGSKGRISVQAVNVDLPDDQRSPQTQGIHTLGVSVNGQSTFKAGNRTISLDDNPGEGNTTLPNIGQALSHLPN